MIAVGKRSAAVWHGPEPIELAGRSGLRYWVQAPFAATGHAAIDERLSAFPLAVFHPAGRPACATPLVLGLQGLAAPYQMSGFIVPTLLDMGIAVALFDTPAAGERSLVRTYNADIVEELAPLVERGEEIGPALVVGLMEMASRDLAEARRFLGERHGLTDERVVLFGVSLGALLTAHAFMRDGLGQRLLGTIGHANLPAFARSYTPKALAIVPALVLRLLGRGAALLGGSRGAAGLAFAGMLRELQRPRGELALANPMHYAERVGAERRVRFLVGAEDAVVRPGDAMACAKAFADGEAYVVPGMGHGGEGFAEHVRYFLGTQLGDWRW
jgi:pimeloyl-ACP methyl ester carboxylesterase